MEGDPHWVPSTCYLYSSVDTGGPSLKFTSSGKCTVLIRVCLKNLVLLRVAGEYLLIRVLSAIPTSLVGPYNLLVRPSNLPIVLFEAIATGGASEQSSWQVDKYA